MKGFKLVREADWGDHSDSASKIFGLYEQQNFAVFANQGKPVLVDIGAADGFWGVGLVAVGIFQKSICFELSGKGRRVVRQTAIENDVSEDVFVFGDAFENTIQNISSIEATPENIFFLIDIEGGEFELLTREFLANFKSSEFLIETHPQMVTEGAEKLRTLEKNASAHFELTYVTGGIRDTTEMDKVISLGDDFKWPIVSEGRGHPMKWLHLTPREG